MQILRDASELCRVLARNGHAAMSAVRSLSRRKRTWGLRPALIANYPKRALEALGISE